MEVLQWTMTVPKDKQQEFIEFHKSTLGPTWQRFGATRFELFKLHRERVAGKDSFPEDTFVEVIYLEEGVTDKEFFARVKADPAAWELSRTYEKQFGARNIVLRILTRRWEES